LRLYLFQQLQVFGGVAPEDRLNTAKEIQYTGEAQSVVDLKAPFFIGDDPGVLENGKVFGDGRSIGADHLGQFTDTSFGTREFIYNEKPGRVGHGLDDFGAGFEKRQSFAVQIASALLSCLAI
jgi:hypothetical protein